VSPPGPARQDPRLRPPRHRPADGLRQPPPRRHGRPHRQVARLRPQPRRKIKKLQ